MERLSGVDQAMLDLESETHHMTVGSLMLIGPRPDASEFGLAEVSELVASKLDRVPRLRQVVHEPAMGLGTPVWVDDQSFDLAHHVRELGLASPGRMDQLLAVCARILARPLDRRRPLWELYVIAGVEGGRTAVLARGHHVLLDRPDADDLVTLLVSREATVEVDPPAAWSPAPLPSSADLARSTLDETLHRPRLLARRVGRALKTPATAAAAAAKVAGAALSVAGDSIARPAPGSVLNGAPGPHRTLAVADIDVSDLRVIKEAFGTTINDVVLAIAADTTGRLLRSAGERTANLWLRALVPVATTGARRRVVSVYASLPMFQMDPVERLRIAAETMQNIRDRHHAAGAEFLMSLGDFAPPTLHAMAARRASRARTYNFLVSNVPGPQEPRWLLDGSVEGIYPFFPLGGFQRFGIAVTSLEGQCHVGFVGDTSALLDVHACPALLELAVDELLTHAQAAR